jgi:dihydrofolate synthase/folylpolyglutamate synthase
VSSPSTLAGWLEHIERQHPQSIALGLDRVQSVLARLALPKFCPIVTVGGTNGKGSTCAMIESIWLAAGHRTGLYTSPHLVDYNERVRIAGRPADDAALVRGFERVEAARGDTPLTYFEFGTLGAWVAFAEAGVEALVLEVGLGGRLDAVNVFDPDCSVLTSVALDHMDWLGDTRERIGWEKAHIFRPGRPAIVADPEPPSTVFEVARAIRADLQCIGRDFGFEGDASQWMFHGRNGRRPGLAYPALRGMNQLLNASAALAAVDALGALVPISAGAIRQGLAVVELPGRFQVLPGRPTIVLDVAHNPHAAAVLAANLDRMESAGETFAVLGMLRDKDIGGVVAHLADRVDRWFVATLPGPRGATAGAVAEALRAAGARGTITECADVALAFEQARVVATDADRIAVFGSFLTVAAVLARVRSR